LGWSFTHLNKRQSQSRCQLCNYLGGYRAVHRGNFWCRKRCISAWRSSFVWADVFTLLLGTVNKSLSGPKCHLRNRRAEARSEPNSKKTIDARESVTVFVLDFNQVGCDNNNNKGKNDLDKSRLKIVCETSPNFDDWLKKKTKMSNKANQSAFILTAVKKRRWKNKKNKGNSHLVFLLQTFILVALLKQEAHAHQNQSHATAGVNSLSCWAAIGNPYLNMHSYVLAWCIIATRGRGRLDTRRLILLLLLIGGIELNPGPQKLCPLCDRTGRKNSIKIKCGECQKWSHAVCLRLTEKEKKTYRQRGYTCYQCSLPATLSDSFLSLAPPLALNETCESIRTNAYDTNRNAPKLLCFNARSMKNGKTGADTAAFMQSHSADLMGIIETWLKTGMRDHETATRCLEEIGAKEQAAAFFSQ
jgi:hypothetical protein